MSLNWRLFQLTQGFRLRLIGAAIPGLGASIAGIGRLALSGYALGLVFQSQPRGSSPPRAAPAALAARHPTLARRASRRRPAACADCARLARLGEPPVAPADVLA